MCLCVNILFKPYKNNILQLDLRSIGINDASLLGNIYNDGEGECNNQQSRLYINDNRCYIARHPNIDIYNNQWIYTQITSVTDNMQSFTWNDMNYNSSYHL